MKSGVTAWVLAAVLLAASCGEKSGGELEPARCNGHESLCERRFDQVVFPGTHNSMSNEEEGWSIPNQHLPIGTQLREGIRVMLLDTHELEGELLLCHAVCAIGSRPLIDALEEIRVFLEQNRREVLTIIFEDEITSEQTALAMEESGLDELVYTHEDGAAWPTLGEMIDSGKRVLVTAERRGPPPAWYRNIWDLAWDTPYSFRSIEELNCDHNRGQVDNDLFLINHWVQDPLSLPELAEEANDYDVLMARVDECKERWERLPTFLAVDFYDLGDLFEVVDVLNGVRQAR